MADCNLCGTCADCLAMKDKVEKFHQDARKKREEEQDNDD